MPRPRVEGIASLILLTCAGSMPAQSLRGDVRTAGTDTPLPFSTVVLEPGGGRFADESGVFSVPQLALGRYRLVVRAIGHLPFDTMITVVPGTVELHVKLPPLGVELPPVTVIATRACLRPGAPSRDTEPEFSALFDQLRENAARFRLLSDAYPFAYWIERRQVFPSRRAPQDTVKVDTLELRSDARRPYKPGGLLINQAGPHGDMERTLRLPTVIDLADSIFHSAHCFGFAGIDSVVGRQWRVDFQAADRVHAPDVAGSAWLDFDSFQLRRLVFRLTRPEKADRSLQSLEVSVDFGDVVSSVTVPVVIVATSETKRGRSTRKWREEQRLLHVQFLKGRPGSQPP